ncbi:MAG TPA: EAL domain-containing protein [Burkholderiaceae bacterium]|nr:EAL domain-containing protein [Burkholderiaceae bacterium]
MSAAAPRTLYAYGRRGWLALHRALMPDYNRPATLYWWTMVLLGAVVLAFSVRSVWALSLPQIVQITVGVLVAMLAGLFPVRVPRSKNSFAAGEIYIFLLLAIHGPAAAVLGAACEAALGAYRTSKRWTSRICSPAIAGLAMFVCGWMFQAAAEALRASALLGPGGLMLLLMTLGAIYAFVNSALVSTVAKLKRGERVSFANWFHEWGWVGLTFTSAGALASLLFLTFKQFGIPVLIVSVPMLAMFLTTLHYFLAQQTAAERERAARVEAAEKVAAQAAQHVRELEQSEKRFQSAFTHASIGMALVSTDCRVLQANRALSALLGCDVSAITGRPFTEFLFGEDAGMLQEQLTRVLRREVEAFSLELRCRDANGREIWASLHCGFFADSLPTEPCLIFQVHDVTARRRAEGRLQHIAYHDSLTNLANRSRFNESLLQALENQREDPSRHFAVMYLDFDRFKLINDSLGHGAGDEFLLKVARRIQEHVRPGDVLARLGGDEFAILTEDVGNTHHAVALAERLQLVLRKPLQIAGKEVSTSASIGITFSDIGYRTPEEVLRDADLAMYKAKAKGKAQFALFDTSLHRRATEQLSLEGDLRRAVETGALQLVFQPIYQVEPRRLVSFEALVRWHHPQRGLISPTTFIPMAEECGLIEPLSHWVLESVCSQLHAWHTRFAHAVRIGMHMNASSRDFASPTFCNQVAEALGRHDLRPSLLTLEITENALMARMDQAADTMKQLRQLGVGLSIDDFGTGYSSLSYLSVLPINSLKIDRSFVNQLQGSAENSEIVRAVITLGASLGKQVIAEGVETESQLEHLQRLGCSHCQGFLLAEPLTARQAGALIESLAPPPGASGAPPGTSEPELLFSAEREIKRLLRIH